MKYFNGLLIISSSFLIRLQILKLLLRPQRFSLTSCDVYTGKVTNTTFLIGISWWNDTGVSRFFSCAKRVDFPQKWCGPLSLCHALATLSWIAIVLKPLIGSRNLLKSWLNIFFWLTVLKVFLGGDVFCLNTYGRVMFYWIYMHGPFGTGLIPYCLEKAEVVAKVAVLLLCSANKQL